MKLLTALMLSWLSVAIYAADWNKDQQSVVIMGYDPVAYFTQGKAMQGSSKHALEWQGATWHFSSSEHQAMFQQSPEKYAPQFGGYCANGLSDGHKVSVNPENWRIIDDRLYLFFSRWGQLQWKVNQQEQIQLATENWLKLKSE